MSADNGVYILRSPVQGGFEFRVVHAMAIDNIRYQPDTEGFNTKEIRQYFGSAKVLCDVKAAEAEASYIADEIMADEFCPILEYGITTINLPFPFPDSKEKDCDASRCCTGCQSTIETPDQFARLVSCQLQNTNLLLKKIAERIKEVGVEIKVSGAKADNRETMRQRTISVGVLIMVVPVVLYIIVSAILGM